MSGEVLKQKLKDLGVSQAELARRLNVIPETIAQALKAKDIKSGFLEDLCRVLDKDISFFYDIPSKKETGEEDETIIGMREAIEALQQENSALQVEIIRLKELKLPTKDSRVYSLWMKFMEITSEMQEMYKEEKVK